MLGERTVTAIVTFQRQEGLPQTGQPDPAVYAALVRKFAKQNTAAPAAGNAGTTDLGAPAANAPSPDGDTVAALPVGAVFANTTWEILDPSGGRLTLAFLPGGGIGGVANPAFWKWRLVENGIVIDYNNGVGGSVRRTGREVSSRTLEGTAKSSRDLTWKWTAVRIR